LEETFGGYSPRMKAVYLKALCLAALVVIVLSLVPVGRTESGTQDTELSFLVSDHPGSSTAYQLNITVPYSLYQYYTQQNHFVFTAQHLSQFITPYTMKPVADRLWQVYNNTEDFTNGVLQIVHQITYQESEPIKYPVETLSEGVGDCDLFAFIAGSILEAGDVPVVLLYYQQQRHMQLAVDVGYQPADARNGFNSVTYQNVTYYIAECTGGSWRSGWRVGECPDSYQNATVQIVGTTYMQSSSSGQVGASLRELDPSTITLALSSPLILRNSNVTITGHILPQQTGENVTLRARSNGGEWFTIGSAQTDTEGRFGFEWMIQTPGVMDVQASWVGNDELNGGMSNVASVWIAPIYVVVFVCAGAVLVALMVTLFAKVKRHRSQAMPSVAPDVSPAASLQHSEA
jgi:hypothetical protein